MLNLLLLMMFRKWVWCEKETCLPWNVGVSRLTKSRRVGAEEH